MGRTLLIAVIVAAALLGQVVLVNAVPLPGGTGPDLTLLAVVGLALALGAQSGAVIGFWAGLAADVLPPAHHALGQYALVFCLAGFAAGRLAERRPAARLPAAMVCVAAAPLLAAGVGALLDDPRVDWPVVAAAWPWAAFYGLLAAPLVVWTVDMATGERRDKGEPVPGYLVRRRV